ncbi:hypothetical protein GCM10009823_01520 [Brevibacterium salitolerans]|uniref:Uncharacterized protein n=1 Tax=Brevibacterium salitolerans TaxID=1403566 RepID=A0ABN2WAV0_9MICO
MGCITLGVADFILVPSPAARTITAAGEWSAICSKAPRGSVSLRGAHCRTPRPAEEFRP